MRHGIKLNDILRCQSFSFSCSKFHTVDLLPFWAIFLRKFTTHPFGVTATRRTQPRPTLRETVQLTLEKRGHLSNQLRLSLKLLIPNRCEMPSAPFTVIPLKEKARHWDICENQFLIWTYEVNISAWRDQLRNPRMSTKMSSLALKNYKSV